MTHIHTYLVMGIFFSSHCRRLVYGSSVNYRADAATITEWASILTGSVRFSTNKLMQFTRVLSALRFSVHFSSVTIIPANCRLSSLVRLNAIVINLGVCLREFYSIAVSWMAHFVRLCRSLCLHSTYFGQIGGHQGAFCSRRTHFRRPITRLQSILINSVTFTVMQFSWLSSSSVCVTAWLASKRVHNVNEHMFKIALEY